MEIRDRPVLLVRSETGALYALENRCPHQSQSLETASVEGETLRCRFHGVIIGLASGELIEESGYAGTEEIEIPKEVAAPGTAVTYPVTERDGAIFVELV